MISRIIIGAILAMIYWIRVRFICSLISNRYKDEKKRKIIKKFPDGDNKGLTILSDNNKFTKLVN